MVDMKINNRWFGRSFVAKIECDANASLPLQIRLAVEWAIDNGADLGGADLRGADLSGVDLRDADLSGADLSGANLDGTDLRSASLSRATILGGANLRGANLSNADMRRVNLRDADLRRANLSGTDLGLAYLIGANLRGTDLHGANLHGADLSETILSGANMSDANLSNANLSGANLRRASLRDADLSGAHLRAANLRDADLDGAVLAYTTALNIQDEEIPVIPGIDAAILAAIAHGGTLDMGSWHGPDEHWCGTTHCRAGWAIHVAGEKGKALEDKVGPQLAATLIYHASRPGKVVPWFFESADDALADIRKCAAEQRAAK